MLTLQGLGRVRMQPCGRAQLRLPPCRQCSSAPRAALGLQSRRASLRSSRASDLQSAVRTATSRPASDARLRPAHMKLGKRFAADSVAAVKLGQVEACKLGKNYAGPEHLLLGILAESNGLPLIDKGIAARVLEESGIALKQARSGVEALSGASGKGLVQEIVEIPLSDKAEAALEQAKREARTLGVPDSVGNEHILIALLREDGSTVCTLLRKLGADVPALREEIMRVTVEESAAKLPAAAEPKKAGPSVGQLAFLPLAAGAALLELRASLVCAAAAVLLCAAVLLSKRRPPRAPAVLPVAGITLLAAAAGWLGGKTVAAATAAEPRLGMAMQCCGVVLSLGVAMLLN